MQVKALEETKWVSGMGFFFFCYHFFSLFFVPLGTRKGSWAELSITVLDPIFVFLSAEHYFSNFYDYEEILFEILLENVTCTVRNK